MFISWPEQNFPFQHSVSESPNYDHLYLGIVLVLVVVVTGLFTYYQNHKSCKIMESFKDMVPEFALVIRSGFKSAILANQVSIPPSFLQLRAQLTFGRTEVNTCQSWQPQVTPDSPSQCKGVLLLSRRFATEESAKASLSLLGLGVSGPFMTPPTQAAAV